MRIFLFIANFILILPFHLNAQSRHYQMEMQLPDAKLLSFNLMLEESGDLVQARLKNGGELIDLLASKFIGDSLQLEHPVFDSYLMLYRNKDSLNGYWKDRSRLGDYRISIKGIKTEEPVFEAKSIQNSRWYCKIDTGHASYPAIAHFTQIGKMLMGTFETETGDFRYLGGNMLPNDSFILSVFDGSHAFLFEGKRKNQQIQGVFYSGTHYKASFYGVLDDTSELGDAFKLTGTKTSGSISLDFPAHGFSLQNEAYKNQPVIIQVMGSWCPNCIDETRYLVQYHNTHINSPKMVALCFERGKDTAVHAQRVNKIRQNLNVPYQMIPAGSADRQLAAEMLPFLDKVMSFPTTIFLNKNHEIVGIHTGFSGPATGISYTRQCQEFEEIIAGLMAH